MWNVVLGFLALAGSVVRDGRGARELGQWEAQRAVTETRMESRIEEISLLEPSSAMTMAEQEAELGLLDGRSQTAGENEWDVACERRQGGELVFDRKSVRDLGGATLFRWSHTAPEADPAIYTAVVDCRAKTIEATWPGKRRTTRAGSCGRLLVEAVCAATPPRAHRAAR
jgi:hypothetical protein